MGVLDFINFASQAGAQVLNQVNQKKVWQREDSAAQRRVKDLRKAGLSPVLAAGSAASTSAPIRVDAPQYRRDVEAQNAGIAQTKAQKEFTDWQSAKSEADSFIPRMLMDTIRKDSARRGRIGIDLMVSTIQKMIAENKMNFAQAEEYNRNIDILKSYGIPSSSTAGADIVAQTRMLTRLFPDMDPAKAGGASVLLRTLMSLLGGK